MMPFLNAVFLTEKALVNYCQYLYFNKNQACHTE